MKRRIQIITGFLSLVLFFSLLQAAESMAPETNTELDQIFAKQGDVILTQGELDAEFSKIPAEYRLSYIRNGERVNLIVQQLLRAKVIAADARSTGYEEDALVKARISLAAEKELADAWMLKVMEDAPEADYAAISHEFYLANPDSFQTEEVVDVTHILISSEQRSNDEALELILSLRDQLMKDPDLFDSMVMEYSEDPSKGMNKGRFPNMQHGQMIAAFEETSFAMDNVGEISEPVATPYGYHLIRLNAKYPPRLKPFEDVKADAMVQARKKYLEEYRSRYIRKLLEAPIELPEGAVETMAKRHFGENFELAPVFEE